MFWRNQKSETTSFTLNPSQISSLSADVSGHEFLGKYISIFIGKIVFLVLYSSAKTTCGLHKQK